ncbi:DUF6252 family protein [Flavobacterium sp. K5-23]|uniref:DUF6252 family protein n=1 Tax=Flavobacterium sp. K5-23 TaxID=2746225 RepID=UPI00200CE73F|nr:DUF6252 family protein [Flavobacterium sp. K5-23]UQD55812.1 hypothetical protein FLAK523_05120 [Flavobacterium sp. K5-23]
MRKFILLVIALLPFVSCQEDVKFNNPSFQGLRDNVFWRAVDARATIASGGALTIKAYTANEVVTFNTSAAKVQTYVLGTSASNAVSYVLTNAEGSITYATGSGFGDGQIVITEYDAVNKTVSGSFRFNAKNTSNNPLGGPSLNFQQGIFYKIPVN